MSLDYRCLARFPLPLPRELLEVPLKEMHEVEGMPGMLA